MNKPNNKQIEAASDEQLAEWSAVYVMGWHKGKGRYHGYWMLPNKQGLVYPVKDIHEEGEPPILGWNPAQNIGQAWELEEKIGKMEEYIVMEYIENLKTITLNELSYDGYYFQHCWIHDFALIHATPKQRTKAALMAVGE